MNRMYGMIAVTFFANTIAAATGTLQIGEPTVEGKQVILPVVLGGDVGTGVSAMDFRLEYNPDILKPTSAEAGSAAASAEKNVMANVKTPGEYAVVMIGMNQTTCQSGEVARIVLDEVNPYAEETEWGLGIARPTMSSVDGTVIASEALPFVARSAKTDSAPTAVAPAKNPDQPAQPATGKDAASGTAVEPNAAVALPAPVPAAPAPDSRQMRDKLAAALDEAKRARAGIGTPGEKKEPAASKDAEAGGIRPAVPGADSKETTGSTAMDGSKNRWKVPVAALANSPGARQEKTVENTATSGATAPLPTGKDVPRSNNRGLLPRAGMVALALVIAVLAGLALRRLTGSIFPRREDA